ncbi:TPA: restriction endonuclease subunit S [Escherichia coli]|nr:restriction endonuclease subunit S [Escherichia coli]
MSAGKLPEGWVGSKLGDVVDVNSGIGFPIKYQGKSSGDYPVYKVRDISSAVARNNGNLNIAGHYVSAKEAVELRGKIFRSGTTVFAKIGEAVRLNRRAIIQTSGLADNNVMAISAILHEMDKFIFHFMNTIDLSEQARSTTVPSIRKGDVENILLSLPPLAEQKIIAEKLDTLLAQVDSTKARLEYAFNKIEIFKRAVMDFAVKGNLTKKWRNKNEINEWVTTQWENILLDKQNSFRRGPFGGALKKDIFVEHGYKVYEQYCPINDDCSFSRYYITEEKFNEMKKFEVHAGDFLISGAGSIGRITLVPEGCEKGIINQALLRVRINDEIYNKKFFLILFRSPMFQKVIVENSTGSAMQNLKSVKELKKIPVPLPSLSEQREIVRRVEQLFAYADTIEKQVNNALARVNNLTQSILAKAFRGELTAQWRAENPELISGENSAAALLEKIKAERAASGGKKTSRKKS